MRIGGDKELSKDIDDPTGEYQRHQRKLRFSRVGTTVDGVIRVTFGLFGLLFCLAALGYLLWTHGTAWLSYLLIICLLAYCAFMAYGGWQRIQAGRRAISTQEVQQAKQQHRQALQEATIGKLPDTYSKGSRYIYLGCALFFGLLAGWFWYLYLTGHTGGDVLGYAIGHSVATAFALLGFLASFGGKAYQQASVAEFRRILQAGEFATPKDSDSLEK